MDTPDKKISVSAAVPATEVDTILSALMDQLFEKFTAAQDADPPQEPSEQEIDALLDAVLYVLERSDEYGSPDELANAIEPTAPKVAEHLRSLKSPESIAAYINLLVALISLAIQLSNVFHHPPEPGKTEQITVNISVTNTSAPPAPSAPDGASHKTTPRNDESPPASSATTMPGGGG